MSVINQMLKDLEQRAPEQKNAHSVVPVHHKPSTVKIVLISLVVILSLNALGFYIWDLQSRVTSSELKAQENKAPASVTPEIVSQENSKPIALVVAGNLSKTAEKTIPITQNLKPEQTAQIEQSSQLEQTPSIEKVNTITMSPNIAQQPTNLPSIEPVAVKTLAAVKASEQAEKAKKDVKPSKMTVSRRQLTTAELVTQKLVKAEKSLNTNQITKAESLFEEVLILNPTHKQARKKLAALWYGRKSYQQAINLLSQGIAIDKQDSDFRMLKARIQLQQGQHKGAYRTLKALPALEQQDYQIMLANVAQQIEAYPTAITAYQLLIYMQPYSGKWHLGLAIVYDKNSQFTLAEKSYSMALSKHDLSSASAEFALQRMQALGEYQHASN